MIVSLQKLTTQAFWVSWSVEIVYLYIYLFIIAFFYVYLYLLNFSMNARCDRKKWKLGWVGQVCPGEYVVMAEEWIFRFITSLAYSNAKQAQKL